MRSVQLQVAVTAFVEQAAAGLHADVLAGQEVPFDLEARGARVSSDRRSRGAPRTGRRTTIGSPLYCYRPLTDAFIAERFAGLRGLETYAPAAMQLERCDTLERYLLARGVESPRRGERHADAALLALLQDVFEEQTDFDPSWLAQNPDRLERVLGRLDGSSLPRAGEVTLVATLHGLAIASPEIVLARGLSIAHPDALSGAPEQALLADRGSRRAPIGGSGERAHLLVLYTATDASSGAEGVAEGAEVVRELLRALRLFGDGRISLGAHAWARVGEGSWSTLALGSGGRPHGALLVTVEQEDELRAFCNLVSRRTDRRSILDSEHAAPRSGHAAGSAIGQHASTTTWALRRFELGCDRADEHEALSDYLLALRALLGAPSEFEPHGAPDGLLAGRLAALCATPEHRSQLGERVLAAIALEREVIAATVEQRAAGLSLVRDLAGHLGALLRDVICGHLKPDLASLADELLLEGETQEGDAIEGETQRGKAIDGATHRGGAIDGETQEGEAIEGETLEGEMLEGEMLEGETLEGEGLSEQALGDGGDAAEVLRLAV